MLSWTWVQDTTLLCSFWEMGANTLGCWGNWDCSLAALPDATRHCCTPHWGRCAGLCGQHTLAVQLRLAQASGRNPPSSPLWEAGGDRPWVVTGFLLLAGQEHSPLAGSPAPCGPCECSLAWQATQLFCLVAFPPLFQKKEMKGSGPVPLAMPSPPPSRHLGEVSWWSWNCPLHKCCRSTGPPVCSGNTKHNWCV